MRNLHKAYYKDYFRDLDFRFLLNGNENSENKIEIKRRNQELTSPNLLKVIEKNDAVTHSFELKISYPGLVTGIGINHEAKIEGEFKLGVHFDYSYGMPIVYGSSVKGVLRTWFKEFFLDKNPEMDAIADRLVKDIFDGTCSNGNKPIYKRDVFFDAVITQKDKNGCILSSDSITPHGGPNKDNPLKNPIPITFMKISSGCTMEFRFKLVNSVIEYNDKRFEFTAEQKLELFKTIITTVGIGAKTNVGYGQFEDL